MAFLSEILTTYISTLLMESNNEAYVHPDFKFIVIKQISEDVIIAAIKEVAKAPHLLQQYGGQEC